VSLLNVLSNSTRRRLTGHQQITDFYLAVLAGHNRGRLATFDGSLAKSLSGTDPAKNIEVVA
jgi:hypothetical protein